MKAPYRNVLCPTDLTPTGNNAVDSAYLLTATGGTVHLVHVDAPPNLGNPLYPDEKPKNAPTPADLEKHRSSIRARLQALVPASATARGVKTQIDLIEDDEIATAIEAEAKRRSADVVVLASHGRWGLSRLAHGESVATRLLHRPNLDVVVVHTDKP